MENAGIAEPTGFAELSKIEQIRYLHTLWDRISDVRNDPVTGLAQQSAVPVNVRAKRSADTRRGGPGAACSAVF